MAFVSTNEIVQSQISEFQAYADSAFSTALTALQGIADEFKGGYQSIGVDWGGPTYPNTTGLPTYVKPAPTPVAPTIELELPESAGEPLSIDTIEDTLSEAKLKFSALTVPVFTDTALPVQLPAPPASGLPAPPADPAPFKTPAYPNAPEYETPLLPELRAITLPDLDAPDLSGINALIASLRASKPVAPVLPETPNFRDLASYYYTLTNNQLTAFVGNCPALASVCPRLAELLAGDSIGIPAAVAQGLRDRAFAAEDRQAFQAEQESLSDWLARGFTLPGGALEAKLAQIRQLNRDKKAQLNRDLWLEEAKLEIENLRFAIQQGIAYEGMLRDSWVKLYGIVQAMAATDIETTLKVLEAALSLYKTQVEAWSVEFSTIKDQIQIELAKVEVYKAELDGQKLIGQLNQQDVELYKARWEAVKAQADVYKTSVDAANGLLQAELGKVEYAAKRIQIYTAQVGAYGEEWKAYGIAAEAEKSKAELFKAQSQAFAARVEAYGKSVDAAKAMGEFDITGLKLRLDRWQGQLEQYKAELQTEISRIDALVKSGGIDADIYKAKAIVEGAYTDFEMKKLDYALNVDKLNSDVALKTSELEQSRELSLQKMALDALDAIARTGSQLAGSAMSAMNVQASLSSGSTTSDNYTEYHYYEET